MVSAKSGLFFSSVFKPKKLFTNLFILSRKTKGTSFTTSIIKFKYSDKAPLETILSPLKRYSSEIMSTFISLKLNSSLSSSEGLIDLNIKAIALKNLFFSTTFNTSSTGFEVTLAISSIKAFGSIAVL